jgi:sensor histidine kinase YesM
MSIARFAYNYLEYKTQNTIKEKDMELTHLREMQQKAELQALQSRINPHFLYNALNSIAGLAKSDPEKTEHMAIALSDFCRYAINKQNETFSTIEEEAEMAKTYLEIEKTRFGEKFSYSIDISDDCRKAIIPRFVIQPLIENAIKHGVAKITKTGVVKLHVIKSSEGLKLSIFDNGPGFPDMPVSGYGLQSIYDKLELLYKGKASMNWVNSPEKCIFITIPYSLA